MIIRHVIPEFVGDARFSTAPGYVPGSCKVGHIIDVVASVFGVRKDEILSRRRFANIVRARSAVMYLSRELTRKSLPQIGRALGGRDHTTVLWGCKRAAVFSHKEEEFRSRLARCYAILTGESGRFEFDDWSDDELLNALFLHDEGHSPLETSRILARMHGTTRAPEEIVEAARSCGVEWADKTPTFGSDA